MEFIAKIQKLHRIAIPKNIFEIMKLKEGDVVKVDIQKVR
jgi:bifunctional DNA-binding transcriptional regulator/antitoxin component of YhaV-PrlF toxin-antitoxin module